MNKPVPNLFRPSISSPPDEATADMWTIRRCDAFDEGDDSDDDSR
jgi:hypothetical protein